MVDIGTRFRKSDLHIHTPASKCFAKDEKSITAAQIVEEAAKKGLEIIGISDHNDIAFIDDVRKEAAKKGIIVFPSIEVSTQEAHLLALFEPDFSIAKLNEFLPYIGIKSADRGEKEAMADSFELVLTKIKEYGGIAIAAHANSDNGILNSEKKGTYRKRVCWRPELHALELINKDHIDNFTSGQVPGYPAKPCVCGSDAHCLADIGQRYIYLKMDFVSINGLKQALIDWPVKVRFPWDSIQPCCPRIQSLTVNQGFFKNVVFRFHPNLTCFVGGTGTGKSTAIEFLRYCFNDMSSFEEIQNDTYEKVEKLIGAGGKVIVEYIADNGEEISISREVTDPMYREEVSRTIVDSDGQTALIPSKPVFFSQGEIARIAMNPIAQLELIDKYIDISDENRQEQETIVGLDTKSYQLVEVVGNLRALNEIITDPQDGKVAIERERDRLQEQLKNPIFTEFPKWESEGRFINQTLEGIDKLHPMIEELLGNVNMQEYFPVALDASSPNFDKLEPLNKVPDTIDSILGRLAEEFGDEVSKIRTEGARLRDEWGPLFVKKQEEYEQFLTELGADDVNKAQARLRALNERLGELAEIEVKAGILSDKEVSIREERRKLLEQLQDTRHSRFEKRLAKAKEWEAKLSGKIKIDIVANGDVSKYIPALIDATTGSHAHKVNVAKVAVFIQPHEIVRAVLEDETTWVQERSGIDPEDIERMVDFLKHKDLRELLKLETTPISDMLRISFELELGKFKPINELAVGTKSIVIVSLAMIEGNAPLVIDQPEDSLDTEFIYTQIVGKLRSEKESRQFIFTSHNANVVVASETDLTHVLTATSDQGSIRSSGGIDRPDTNRLILLHLEGGPDAFKLRTQKYEQSMT